MFFFTDGKDLKGIKRSQDIKYMKVLRYSLSVISAWPEDVIEAKVSRYHSLKKCYIFLLEVICLMPGILYLKNNVNKLSFYEMGHTYITVSMNVVAICRLVLIFLDKYSDTIGYFVKVIHLFNLRNQSEYAMKVHLRIHKMSHFFTMFSNAQMIIAIIMFNGAPICNNYLSGAYSGYTTENVSFEQAVYYSLPFDYKHNFNGYLIVFSFNWYISYVCTSCFCIFDLLMSIMVFHVWGHMKILIYNLENFPRPRATSKKFYANYSRTEMKIVHRLLQESIAHHCLIKDFVKKMSDTFGPILVIYFCFQQITGCLVLLECSQLNTNALIRYGLMTVIFFQQVIQIYTVFELLGSLGGVLSDTIYSVPWECMDESNRRIVYVFLKQSQKFMNLKAMNMVPIGVNTMTMIIKTSLSYFIMLRTLADLG